MNTKEKEFLFDPEGLFSTIPAIPQVLFGLSDRAIIFRRKAIFNGLEISER